MVRKHSIAGGVLESKEGRASPWRDADADVPFWPARSKFGIWIDVEQEKRAGQH
jgi:hypothetical protein